MNEIDDMDLIYYLKVLAYGAGKKDREAAENAPRRFIDEVWPM